MEEEFEEGQLVTLVYNEEHELEVSRARVASSCFYLRNLLEGKFREAKQSRVNIKLPKEITFQMFKGLIDYANTGFYAREGNLIYYMGLVQLAALWLYDELVEIVENTLIDYVDEENILELHFMSDKFCLKKLYNECLKFEYLQDRYPGTQPRKWSRCPLVGHEHHHYLHCQLGKIDQSKEDQLDDWNEDELELVDDDHEKTTSLHRARQTLHNHRRFMD